MAVRNSPAAVEVKSYNWFQKNVLASEEPPNIAESSHKAPTEKAHWIRVDVSGHSQVICSPLTDDYQKAHRGLAEDWEMTQRGLVRTSHRLHMGFTEKSHRARKGFAGGLHRTRIEFVGGAHRERAGDPPGELAGDSLKTNR